MKQHDNLEVDLANSNTKPDKGLDQEKGRELVLVVRLGKVSNLSDIDAGTSPIVFCALLALLFHNSPA